MKLSFRIYLQPGADFELHAEPTDTIRDLKVKINKSHGFDIDTLNVVFCADNLDNDKTLESCGIREEGFLVLSISKPEGPLPVPPEIGVIEYYDNPEKYEFDMSQLDIRSDEKVELPIDPTAFDLELMSSLTSFPPVATGPPFKYRPLMASASASETPASDGDPPSTSGPPVEHLPVSPRILDPGTTTSTTPVPPLTTVSTFKYRPLDSSTPDAGPASDATSQSTFKYRPLDSSVPDAGPASDATSQSTFKYRPLDSSAPPAGSTPDAASQSTFKYRPLDSSIPGAGSTSDAASQSTFKYRPLDSSVPSAGSTSDAASQSTFKYRPLDSSAPSAGSTSDAASQSTFKYRPLDSSAPSAGSTSDAASQSTFKYRPLSSSSSAPFSATTSTAGSQQGSGLVGGTSSVGTSGLGDTTSPSNVQMAQFRQLLTQNPEMRQLFVQQLAQDNPELGQLFTQNPDLLLQFLDRMGQDGGTAAFGNAAPGAQAIGVNATEADRQAIERLEALGFPKQAVIEAYFACDKNEQLAANYLLENA